MAVDFKKNDTSIPLNQNQMDSGSEPAFIGSWGSSSSSSFLTTSFGSELDSNDTDPDNGGDEDEFIAELTRKMADYMLEENDENPHQKHSGFQKPGFQDASHGQNQEQTRRSYADTVKKSIVGFQSDQSFPGEKQPQPPVQVYQVENQPRVWGRRGKMSESINGGKGYSGVHGSSAGMRAIFLGGSGWRKVSGGTGVFLPRSTTDATDHSRKKPGCSTVLVPTRVLQALEQHFNNMESLSPSTSSTHTYPSLQVKKSNTQAQSQPESVSVDHEESKLPQEWIY